MPWAIERAGPVLATVFIERPIKTKNALKKGKKMKKFIQRASAFAVVTLMPIAAFAGDPGCVNGDCSGTSVSVPEPSTFSLMAIALAAAAVFKFRNRNK